MSGALRRLLVAALAASWAVTPAAADDAPGGALLQAMRDELRRSMAQLGMEGMEKPYFIAYRVNDVDTLQVAAAFGALTASARTKSRWLTVEVRVGSAELDNTNFFPARASASPAMRVITLPLEDDYQELRRQLWLNTDAAYKRALETLARKRAALKTRRREDVPDFTAEAPNESIAEIRREPPRVAAAEALTRKLSAAFKEMPHVDDSRVATVQSNLASYYANSEGSAFAYSRPAVRVRAQALAHAEDGTLLQDFEDFHARAWDDLPDEEALLGRVRALGAALAARREAQPVERYSGPILFEGQAAAELLVQALGAKLLAVRVPVADSADMAGVLANLRNPFVDKIGARVLPRFLGLRDDPTLGECGAAAMLGGYPVDANGVPAAPTALVENGVLKTLLASRNPIAGILRSTGNQRGDFLMPSNLVVVGKRGMSAAELREELLLLAAERGNDFGVVVRRVASPGAHLRRGDGARGTGGHVRVDRLTRVFKVHPDGREEPIRQAELSGIGDSNFKEIVAASESASGHTLSADLYRAAFLRVTSALYGMGPSTPNVSVCTPDLLFEELTLRKPQGNALRPPVARHPYFD